MHSIEYTTDDCCICYRLTVDYDVRRGARHSYAEPGWGASVEIKAVTVNEAWFDFDGARFPLSPDKAKGWKPIEDHFCGDLAHDPSFVDKAIEAASADGAITTRG